jgi:hypothetical protein
MSLRAGQLNDHFRLPDEVPGSLVQRIYLENQPL